MVYDNLVVKKRAIKRNFVLGDLRESFCRMGGCEEKVLEVGKKGRMGEKVNLIVLRIVKVFRFG